MNISIRSVNINVPDLLKLLILLTPSHILSLLAVELITPVTFPFEGISTSARVCLRF